MKSRRLLVVVYDGIQNSVFESLVLDPAKKRVQAGQYAHVDILSFEVNTAEASKRARLLSVPGVSILVAKKLPFIGKTTLFFQAPTLAKQLSTGWYEAVIARGPLAGFIVKIALSWFMGAPQISALATVTVQARGLAAEEARLAFDIELPDSFFRKMLFSLRIKRLRAIEESVYNAHKWPRDVCITAVSTALRTYLIEKFSAVSETVIVDDFDRIPMADKALVSAWRHELRNFLKIPQDAIVYGYSGSYKYWQCAEETVAFIARKIQEDPRVYGIILSTDLVPFQSLISTAPTDKRRFLVRYVAPKDILQWLSLCDYGVILRYQDVVNWVARPTKALEYLAVGLSIIHNNTIKWLIDYDAQVGASGSETTPQPRQTSLS